MTVQLPEELEQAIREKADALHMDPHEFAVRMLERDLLPDRNDGRILWNGLTVAEWTIRFDEWVSSHRDLPSLPDEALTRESFYRDDG